MLKTILATALLLILAFVIYAAYYSQNEEVLDLTQIEQVVKPKIADIKHFIGTIKEKLNRSENEPEASDEQDTVKEEAPAVRYPVPEEQEVTVFKDQQQLAIFEQPLPELDKSDKPIKELVDRLLSNEFFGGMLRLEAVILRFVVTVDNLTHKKLPNKYRLVKPTAGKFLTLTNTAASNAITEKYIVDDNNSKRYAGFIRRIESIEASKLVAVYVYYYPLIQEAYDSLGYSGRYFNDRFVEVIDHLLDTPKMVEPFVLERSTISYKYANADLEARSAGQKIMMRVGKVNATKLRKKLLQLRAGITKFEPDL